MVKVSWLMVFMAGVGLSAGSGISNGSGAVLRTNADRRACRQPVPVVICFCLALMCCA